MWCTVEREREREGKKIWTIEFSKLYDRTSVDQAIDRRTQGAHRSTERSTDLDSKEEIHWIGRLIFPISPAKDWSIEQSIGRWTALLERSTGRSDQN